mgnify:CR=1 FL=1
MQEDKEPIIDTAKNIELCLLNMEGMIREIEPVPEKMMEALQKGYPTATDLADYLVTNLKLYFDKFEVNSQFSIVEYFKQLYLVYNHPKFVVDFLVIYNSDGKTKQSVIEYDGLKDHFENTESNILCIFLTNSSSPTIP